MRPSLVPVYVVTMIVVFCLGTGGALASGGLGGTSLNLGVGARAESMGGAFVGVANDTSALYWNPAGIGQLPEPRFSGLHTEWVGGIRYEWVGFVQPIGDLGAIGVSGRFLYGGEVLHTVETTGRYEERGTFEVSTRHMNFALGTALIRRMRFGLAVELLSEELAFSSATSEFSPEVVSTQVTHLGALYLSPVPGLRLGAALRNIGGRTEFLDEGAPLPRVLQVGAAYERRIEAGSEADEPSTGGESSTVRGRRVSVLTFALDVRAMREQGLSLRAGAEYAFRDGFAVRAGYRSDGGDDVITRLSGGLGYATDAYEIDYGFVPMGNLGGAHRAEFTLLFH